MEIHYQAIPQVTSRKHSHDDDDDATQTQLSKPEA
jgi:hypothetical protein